MKQVRPQPLTQTYQKLGTLLFNTASDIQTTNCMAATEWASLIQQVKTTYAIYKIQAEKEEAILFPILHNYEPALVAILRDDQCKRMHYLSELSALLAANEHATNKEKMQLYSHKLLYRLDEFVATTLQQMNEHDKMVNQVLWRYFNDKELACICASISLAPTTLIVKADHRFADNIIRNLKPYIAAQPSGNNKAPLQHRANTALALAI